MSGTAQNAPNTFTKAINPSKKLLAAKNASRVESGVFRPINHQ